MEISPYLSAIQSLNGLTPGEKYKSLHSIANQIIQNEDEKKAFLESGSTSRVQPALLPFLRILIGNKLKLKDFVIEALKSDDVVIVEQALRAKWFFNADNEYIQLDYILEKVIPFVSQRTRRRLMKTLGRCLVNDSRKAEAFFTSFFDLYGIQQTLPILVYCSEQFIYDAVLRHRILLPNKILRAMYLRYPTLVLRYLQLGNKKNDKNLEDRKLHSINVKIYAKFLPVIIKYHTQDFVEIFENTYFCYTDEKIKVGSTRAKFVLANSTDLLIRKAKVVFKTMPLKVITNKLSTKQFETMFVNTFPSNIDEFRIEYAIRLLRCYPVEKRFLLLREKYELAYGEDILDEPRINKANLFELLPLNLKEDYAKKLLKMHDEGTDEYYYFMDFLPPKEAIPIMKACIASGSTQKDIRIDYFDKMIASCKYYDSKDDLLQVIQYCYDQTDNELSDKRFINNVLNHFKLDELDKSCWQVLILFTQKLYVRGELHKSKFMFYWDLFRGGLLFFTKEYQKNPKDEELKQWFDQFMSMLLNCNLEPPMNMEPLPLLDCSVDNSEIWETFKNELALVSYIVEAIDYYDFKRFCKRSLIKYKQDLKKEGYPWLTVFLLDLLKHATAYMKSKGTKKYPDFEKNLKRHNHQLHRSFINFETESTVSDININVDISVLKNDPSKIHNKWKEYLDACREKSQHSEKSARKFIKKTKMHHDLPIKFVKQCLLQIKNDGSIFILSLLLEGEAYGKIISPFTLRNKRLDLEKNEPKVKCQFELNLIESMKNVNPPVSFEVMSGFYHDQYKTVACNAMCKVADRVSVDKVIVYANQLINKTLDMRIPGVKLICQVLSYPDLEQFVIHDLASEINRSIRTMVAETVWNLFKQAPSNKTWQLMQSCIDGLISEDQPLYDLMRYLNHVNKDFLSAFLRKLFNKINGLEEPAKSRYLNIIFCEIRNSRVKHLFSDDILEEILRNQFSECKHNFELDVYLFFDQDRFDRRLNTLIDILCEKFEEYKDHPRNSKDYFSLSSYCYVRGIYCLHSEKKDMVRKFINALIDLASKKLKLQEEMRTFMCLYLVKNYLESTTFQEYGIKCAHTARLIIETFGSDMFLIDITDFIKDTLKKGIYYQHQAIMETIEGLAQVDERLAALIGLNMFGELDVNRYEEKCNELLEKWSRMKDLTVLAVLNNYKNNVLY